MTGDSRYAWARQLAAFAILVGGWEAAGRANLLNPLYAPNPSRIAAALAELFSDGRIWPHLEATFSAALGGLALGILVGALLGVAAAGIGFLAELLEPVMTVLNAIPRVILAPLFVIWLGIGLASKIALAFILVAVLIFFTVFTGIRQVDRRLVERVVTLGGGRWARPGCSVISRSRSVSPSRAPASVSSWPPRTASVISCRSRRVPTMRR
jgi:NitT/TauT family transport system permease protein